MAREPIKTRTPRSSLLEGRYVESGMIQPGTDRKVESLGSLIGRGVQKATKAIKKAVVPMNRPATAEEDESYKLRGQKAYYDAKIKRLGKK